MATTRCCICILQQAFNDSRKESKIVRRVQQVMNILPSFSPYPSSSLPLTTTDTKGSARDNEQEKSKIMVAERSEPRKRLLKGCASKSGRFRLFHRRSPSLSLRVGSCTARATDKRRVRACRRNTPSASATIGSARRFRFAVCHLQPRGEHRDRSGDSTDLEALSCNVSCLTGYHNLPLLWQSGLTL